MQIKLLLSQIDAFYADNFNERLTSKSEIDHYDSTRNVLSWSNWKCLRKIRCIWITFNPSIAGSYIKLCKGISMSVTKVKVSLLLLADPSVNLIWDLRKKNVLFNYFTCNKCLFHAFTLYLYLHKYYENKEKFKAPNYSIFCSLF